MAWQERAMALIQQHQRGVTAALVLVFAATGCAFTAFLPIEGSEAAPDLLAYALVLSAAATLWFWRSNPLPALALCTLLVVVYWVRDYPGDAGPVLWLLFYAATRHGGEDRTRVWRYVGVSLAVILTVALVGVTVATEDLPLIAIVGIFFIYGTAAAVGEAIYQRSQYVAELEQRAAALEGDIESKAALAAVEERTRIAREMHDIIAHGMSSVVVQSVAAQSVVDTDPSKAREVLQTIESIGRDSVDEMRRMLGVLRADDRDLELEPQPDFTDLAALARNAEEAGVEVHLAVVGSERVLPPGLELTAYRVVQEALTNVMRHAGRPVRVDIDVHYRADSLGVTVIDDGLGAAASTSTAGSGHGLLGMSERVEIYNGTFAAGPRPGGGFEVQVSLPLPAHVSA